MADGFAIDVKLRTKIHPMLPVHDTQHRYYFHAANHQAAEAMDRAAASPLEQKVPPRYVRAFCGKEKHAQNRWKATRKWRKENEIDSILNEPQPFFHDIRRYFPSHM